MELLISGIMQSFVQWPATSMESKTVVPDK